jgi:ABC-type glycerol-3-phosphate transport system permease component
MWRGRDSMLGTPAAYAIARFEFEGKRGLAD